jgi:hypothetical protein
MKVRKTLLVAAAGWAGLTAQSTAQSPVAATAPASTPAPLTIWQKLGFSKAPNQACDCEPRAADGEPAEPTNLWDLLTKPRVSKAETVVVQRPPAPKPAVAKGEVVVTKPGPAATQLTLAPAALPKPPTLDFPPPAPMDEMPAGPSPYYATAATPTTVNRPTEPVASVVSSYHPTAAMTASPPAVVKANPTPCNGTVTAPAKPTPVAKAAPAQLPTPAAMPATPLSTKPTPAPAATVVPAATVPAAVPTMPSNSEVVDHLLMTAKGNGPFEDRKASIRELAKMKANTPEVMVALDGLSDDPTPAVRAEAIIAAARLRMGR